MSIWWVGVGIPNFTRFVRIWLVGVAGVIRPYIFIRVCMPSMISVWHRQLEEILNDFRSSFALDVLDSRPWT